MHIDLSHAIEHGLVTYKGIPAPIICDFLSREDSKAHYSDGTSFHIGRIDMVANTGTYIDSPFHRYENGRDLSGLELARIAGVSGVVVRATDAGSSIDASLFEGLDVNGKAVLVETGWCRKYKRGQIYFFGREDSENKSVSIIHLALNFFIIALKSRGGDS